MMVGFAFSELLIVLLMGGAVTGGGILGLPPGERDAALLRTAPTESLVYLEWAERSPGEPGAMGVDGFMADPETKLFLARVEGAILKGMKRSFSNGGPEGRVVAENVPAIVKAFLVRPGCLYASFDEEAAAKALTSGPANGVPPRAALLLGIEAAVVLNAGDGADDLADRIHELLNLANIPPNARSAELKHQAIPMPSPAIKLEIHREGDYFVLAFGENVGTEAAAAITGDAKGLHDNERFTKAIANAEIDRTGSVAWIDVKGILNATIESLGFEGMMVKSVAESLGLDAVDSFVTVNGVVDGRMATRSFLTTGGSVRGLLALFDGRPLTPEDFAEIPGDSDVVYAFTLDTRKVMAAIREMVVKSDPTGFAAQQMNKTLEQLDEELGFSIEKDAFEAFGDVWSVFDSPNAGGLFVTGLVGSIEVRDHEKATAIHGRLMELLEATMPGITQGQYRRHGVELRREEFLGHEIAFVNTMDDDMPFAPAFCLTKDQWLVAPNPQALKAQLRFLASEEANFGDRLAELAPLGDDPAVSLAYVDPRRAVQSFYAFVPYFAQSMMGAIQSSGGDITVFAIPSARAVLPYSKDSFGRTTRTADGIKMEWNNGLPIPGATTVLMQLPSVGWLTFRNVGRAIGANGGGAKMAPPVAVPVRAMKLQRAVQAARVVKERAIAEKAAAEAEAAKAKAAARAKEAAERRQVGEK